MVSVVPVVLGLGLISPIVSRVLEAGENQRKLRPIAGASVMTFD